MGERELHPDLTAEERRALVWEGIERFNAGRFYDAHESWEEVWRSTTPEPRDLFQGLVQVAAGMHHALDRAKPEPARRVLAKGRKRLEPLAPACCGINLIPLIEAVAAWEDWLHERQGSAPAPPSIQVVDSEQVG